MYCASIYLLGTVISSLNVYYFWCIRKFEEFKEVKTCVQDHKPDKVQIQGFFLGQNNTI